MKRCVNRKEFHINSTNNINNLQTISQDLDLQPVRLWFEFEKWIYPNMGEYRDEFRPANLKTYCAISKE
jgi:hypothetical protein